MDLAYRCNFVATIEGLIADKMIVDTIYGFPEYIPYWAKSILFFVVTLPVNIFTLLDDAIGLFIVF
jgi:hypothetical protein